METKSEYEPTPRFPLFPSANDQRAKSESEQKGADGWWLVAGDSRMENRDKEILVPASASAPHKTTATVVVTIQYKTGEDNRSHNSK